MKLEHRERNILTVLLPHPSFGIVYFLSFFLTHSHKKSNPEPTTHKHRQSRIYSLTHTGEGIHHIIITKEQRRTARRHNLKILSSRFRFGRTMQQVSLMKSSSHSDPPSLPPSAREEKLIHLLEQALAARAHRLRRACPAMTRLHRRLPAADRIAYRIANDQCRDHLTLHCLPADPVQRICVSVLRRIDCA